MEPSRSHRLIHVINNWWGSGQYNTNSKTRCIVFGFIVY